VRGAGRSTPAQQRLRVAHMVFRTTVHRETGITFGLYPDLEGAETRAALFSGHIEPGMGDQLRALAAHVDELEAQLPPSNTKGRDT
jgi:hypothetical protein